MDSEIESPVRSERIRPATARRSLADTVARASRTGMTLGKRVLADARRDNRVAESAFNSSI